MFWGGGHVLQFAYTQAFMIVYILVLDIERSVLINTLSIINVFFVLPTIFIYFIYKSYDPVLIEFFTLHMKYVGGLFPLLVILYGLKKIFNNSSPEKLILLWSIGLFVCLWWFVRNKY